jgi:hypothetical protein
MKIGVSLEQPLTHVGGMSCGQSGVSAKRKYNRHMFVEKLKIKEVDSRKILHSTLSTYQEQIGMHLRKKVQKMQKLLRGRNCKESGIQIL